MICFYCESQLAALDLIELIHHHSLQEFLMYWVTILDPAVPNGSSSIKYLMSTPHFLPSLK